MQGIEVGIDEILNCREKRVVIQNAMIRKSTTFWINEPYAIAFSATSPCLGVIINFKFVKFIPPVSMEMMGIIISLTKDVTILPKAPPMITPIAISKTLPLKANSLKSFNICPPIFSCA